LLAGLFLLVLFLCTGCENKQENSIQWQLPLQAPEDAHAANPVAVLPDWASANEGAVDLMVLHKNTARITVLHVEKGQVLDVDGWRIRLLGLAHGLRVKSGAFIDDESVHNAAAFVELIRDQQVLYRGWLYLDFPELFGLDDAGWKVWLKSVSVQPSSSEDKKLESRLP